MKILPYFFALFLVVSCNLEMEDVKKTASNPPDSTNKPIKTSRESHIQEAESSTNYSKTPKQEIDVKCIECIPVDYKPEWNIYNEEAYAYNPGTYSPTNYIYDSADSINNVIDTLKFGERLNILKEYKDYYLVCTPKSKAGFIKKADVFLYSFSNYKPRFYYYCGVIHNKYFEELKHHGFCQSTFQILKANTDGEIVEVFSDTNVHRRFIMSELYSTALKDVRKLFQVKYHYIYAGVDKFIIDNGKIMNLISSKSFGDGGYYDQQSVYLPIVLDNGKVVLVRNGKLELDRQTMKANIYPYPAEIGIPIEDLIVVEYVDAYQTSEYNNNGSSVIEIYFQKTTYYQWDGKELHEVKTVIQKEYEE